MASDPEGYVRPSGPRRRPGVMGVLVAIVRPIVRYPRVSIEAFLTVVSVALGLYFLPISGTAMPPDKPAVQYLMIQPSRPVPTYVLDRAADTTGPDNEVIVGMDVPAGTPAVTWTLYIVYSNEDHVVDRNASAGVTFGAVDSSSTIGIKGYRALEVNGSTPPGSDSYTEYQGGFNQAVSRNGILGGGEPKDQSTIDFVVSGPVPSMVVSGSTMAVSLPGIMPIYQGGQSDTSATPFNAELLFDAGTYQSQIGGPTVQAGTDWDWFSQDAVLSPTTATGVDNGEAQSDQNNLFLAAVFFGLAAAAGAAFGVELVEALQERSREKRAAQAALTTPSG